MKACEWVSSQRARLSDLRFGRDTDILPRAKTADGFEISIQASQYHYCCPRITFDGPYTAYELGYPSEDETLIESYREGDIFPFVPSDLVEELVEKHGGIVGKGGSL